MSSPPKKVPIHLQSSQNRLLIKNGRIVNDDSIFDADIFIENGVIAQIGHNLVVPGGVRIIDAKSPSPNEVNYILPGGLDTHVHLQTQFMDATTVDDYYNGTKAALAGGTTTILNFALTSKQAPGLIEAFERERAKAEDQACCDYGIHVVISDWVENKTEHELARLVNEFGVNSFKIFLCYGMQLSDKQIVKILKACSKYGAIVVAHCENGDIIEHNSNRLIGQGLTGPEAHLMSRPECIEAEATHRVSVLSEQVGCPVMVAHVNSKSAAKVIVDERSQNSSLFGETLGASIGTDGTHYFNKCWRHAAAHVMSPPLRADKSTPGFLLGCLAAGSLQVLGSDHCVFSSQQKAQGENDFRKIPNGVNGIEERMLVAWEKGVRGGYLDPCKFVAITSTNAAKLFNLYPRKGRIQVGSDADLVIWGRNVKTITAESHVSKCDFNIFEGTRIESGPLVVVAAGRVVLDQTGLHVVQGGGRYLARQPFPITAYGPLKIKNRLVPIGVDRSSGSNGDEPDPADELERKVGELSVQAGAAAASAPTAPGSLTGGRSSQGSPRPDTSDSSDSFRARSSKSGNKNMQDSTFKLSGEQFDDKLSRSNIRVSGQPPGGKSSGLW